MKNSEEITIRSIQHFLYCPHRWGLMEIDKAWAENYFVTKANLLHERVHDPDRKYSAKGKKVFTSVSVYNDEEPYNLYGVTDCLECTPDSAGTEVDGIEGRVNICIVEYKPKKPKGKDFNYEDLMQVFAQKICVDYTFGTDCDGTIYYADVKERIELPLKENYAEYDMKLRYILKEMRSNLETGTIPAIRKGQKCSGCSMKDMCMPKAVKAFDVRKAIQNLGEI